MNKATFRYLQDPGHGWLEVPRQLLAELGIEYDITTYSYIDGPTVYLEEDCDATTFINAFKAQCTDIELDFKEVFVNYDHPVRRLRSYPLTRPQLA